MRATCWMHRKRVEVRDVPDPQILNTHDAIVRITSTAICGSDLHLVDGYVPTMKRGDVMETIHLSKKTGPPQSGKLIRKAVTINRPRQEVEAAWVAAEEIRQKVEEAGASVRFADAPGDRGTELIVEFLFDPPGGDFGVAAAKLTGKDLATQLSDDLRRLKQELEAGQVVRSDGAPAGHDLANHLKQRAAQPLKEAVR